MPDDLMSRLKAVKAAAKTLRSAASDKKNEVLLQAAKLIDQRRKTILLENQADIQALPADVSVAFRDRLLLNDARLSLMMDGLRQVAALADPVDEVVETRTLENGLSVRRARAPLGVILMIFESRPNVAVEAFSLAFKAGNAIILRGGKESMRTTAALYQVLAEALRSQGFPESCLWGITNPDRALTRSLLEQKRYVDVVVPRGGDRLIEFVVENTAIPIIKNDRGLCHVYVHEDADLEMAEKIVVNAKCQRPGVCNAMETLLVHSRVAERLLPALYGRMKAHGVQWFACSHTLEILKNLPDVSPSTQGSWDTEYLDYRINSVVVDSLDAAIAHIEEHGSRHSEAIVTSAEKTARRFQAEVDAAAVYWNASTRFTDGYELGLGGELGVSTQKLHVRGPVGLRELTCPRWIIDGTGQVRN